MATLYKKLNGVRIAMTEAEVAEHKENQRKAHLDAEAGRAKRAALKAKAASGKTKLKDLGLDDEEIKALTGA
jgi:hypothetical protein